MKKAFLLLMIFLNVSNVFSQGYQPMLDSISNNWYFVSDRIPVRVQQSAPDCNYAWYNGGFDAVKMYTPGDTVIGGNTYKILLEEKYSNSFTCYFGYIREDTAARKIYFVDNVFSPEILLYDFSMQPGDSIHLDFINSPQFGIFTSGKYVLDSIAPFVIETGVRNAYYLHNPASLQQFTLRWIESVGHTGHLVYTHSGNEEGLGWCNYPGFYQLLSCFEHSSQKVYFDSCNNAIAQTNWCWEYIDSCHYWNICSALPENTLISDFKITPNPVTVSASLIIEANVHSDAEIELYQTDGRKIMSSEIELMQGRNEQLMETGNLASAIYFVALKTKAGTLYRKMIRTE